MIEVQQIIKTTGQKNTVFTADQQLYKLLVGIKWAIQTYFPVSYLVQLICIQFAKLRATRALATYVPPAPRTLVPHVSCALGVLVPSVLSCLTCLVHTCPCALRSLCLTYSRDLVPRALRALVPHVLCAIHALVRHVSYMLF